MSVKRQITEYLDIDLDRLVWCCNRCGRELISARENYKKGCLVNQRDPRTINDPVVREGARGFSADPEWVAVLEFYCPACGVMIETETLPLGHPVTHDIELDLDALKEKAAQGR
ncbi:MAG: acetone carboxylase subunit gamma [Thermodesulfobacteriota bacterium]